MSRLSDVIQEAIESIRDDSGNVNIHTAMERARPLLDDEDCETLISEGLSLRIKNAALRGKNAAREAITKDSKTLEMFPGLRSAYAIDAEERVVKQTRALSMLEFQRIIATREKQVSDDRAHLKILRDTLAAVSPTWAPHPTWTFGEAADAYAKIEAA